MPEPNALTGAAIDRAADRRRTDDAWIAAQREGARALVLGDAGVRVAGGSLDTVALTDAPGHAHAVLLGVDDEGPLWAIDEDPPGPGPGKRVALVGAGGMRGEAAPDAPDRVGMRSAAQTLSHRDGGLVAYAAALLNWHRSHRFCAVCGGTTTVGEAGMVRRCDDCGTHHHPRTDPVVIMLVHDGDRVLLGRQAAWPARRYSALAGFVSPGESLEEAVEREVLEEVGVAVGTPVYHSSQPWPFPCSLMLGFLVPYAGGDLGGSDDELQDAAWFGRDEVREATRDDSWDEPREGDGLLLPPRSAIARRLVEEWVAG